MKAFFLVTVLPIVAGKKFRVALWGDIPYGKNFDTIQTAQDVMDSISASIVDLSIFDGDTKDGSSPCTNQSIDDMKAIFESSTHPAIYVPGDNEWTDCHRTNNNDNAAAPQQQLAYIRQTMFSSGYSLGQKKIALTPLSSDYPETNRFIHKGVYFITFNMPGSNNNFVATAADCISKTHRTAADCAATNAEYAARDAANIAFLQDTFADATAQGIKAIMIVMQGAPAYDNADTSLVESAVNVNTTSGYANFLTALYPLVQNFAGEVAHVHGDDHEFIVDYPWPSATLTTSGMLPGGINVALADTKAVKNFVRHCTFGSPNKAWTMCRIDPEGSPVFKFSPVWVA